MIIEKDSLYLQGLKHFGKGEWSEAIACFTQLSTNYPEDKRVHQFLESAQMRATMGTGLQRGVRSEVRGKWLRRFLRVVVVLILVALVAGVYQAYQTWVVPVQEENARLAGIEQLRQAAEIQIASGLYAAAIETYEEILAEQPDDSQARAGQVRARQLEQLAGLYTQMREALEAGNETDALRLLEEISVLDPNYRDASSLINQIKSTQALLVVYDDAVGLFESRKWEQAVEAFDSIRTTSPGFRPNDVAQYLFDAYVVLGDQQVEQADTITALEIANVYYQQALRMRPLDPHIETARRVAESFIDGAEAYRSKDWDNVIRKLSVVYEQQPEYFGGKVSEWLYEAFIATGDLFLGNADPFGARDRYAEALRLATTEEQREEAQQRYDEADTLTTPTPTPRPEPTPQPEGWIAPAWTRRPTGTPSPYPFELIAQTYIPNTFTGEGCEYAGVAGRIFDRRGAPLTADTLGVRITGFVDTGLAAGSHKFLGDSGWMIQFDVRAKKIKGYVQVYYKDTEASALIPFVTRQNCFENMLIIDIQQTKPLP